MTARKYRPLVMWDWGYWMLGATILWIPTKGREVIVGLGPLRVARYDNRRDSTKDAFGLYGVEIVWSRTLMGNRFFRLTYGLGRIAVNYSKYWPNLSVEARRG